MIGALGPSAALLPAAMPVINWRAFSLAVFIILLISLLWEATLAVPYGWWGFQDQRHDRAAHHGVEPPSD